MSARKASRGRPPQVPLSPFGERLKAAIERSRFRTREEFRIAAGLQCRRSTRTRWLRVPRGDVLVRLASLLGTTVAGLLGVEAENSIESVVSAPNDTGADVIRFGRDARSRVEIPSMLDDIARKVRGGEIDAVAIACVLTDGAVGTGYGQAEGSERPFTLIGGLRMLEARIVASELGQ